jgi:hypothetical protein
MSTFAARNTLNLTSIWALDGFFASLLEMCAAKGCNKNHLTEKRASQALKKHFRAVVAFYRSTPGAERRTVFIIGGGIARAPVAERPFALPPYTVRGAP